MKSLGLLLLVILSGIGINPSFGCTATLDECNRSCLAIAPPGGSESCYTDGSEAVCIAYDADDVPVSEDRVTCGGGGAGGDGGNGACFLYWWLCDPWAY